MYVNNIKQAFGGLCEDETTKFLSDYFEANSSRISFHNAHKYKSYGSCEVSKNAIN